ncbi:hypothetical protein [Demequina rhizosphaerae]|uniref:hypothetical protein n=1 Tax=Demequina rhizosphaerae TaxID=1638985 RepID=UPI0012E07289|nr:hypothetical protein [Demequina rhizosphaerae]
MHFVRWISKPDKGVHNPVSHFLRLSGIDAALHSNGHVWKRSGNIDVERSRRLTPFVVTHLATHDEVPNLRSGTLQAQRPTVEMWASLMTSRHPLQRGYVAPSHDANTPARHHSQFGSTHVQASRNALTFITTESFETRSKAHTTHSRISQLAHLHAVRMAMLAIRQRDFLDGHADALARLDWGQPVKTIRDHAIRLEKAQMQFQNKVWLARIPERPQFNMVMTLLSEASEIQALLRDISDESASISRVLELDNARESHRSWEALNRLVAYLALPAVLLSAASLWAATNMTFAARSLGIAVAAALSAWLLIGWHTRRGN